jgi:ATP diphosphatase
MLSSATSRPLPGLPGLFPPNLWWYRPLMTNQTPYDSLARFLSIMAQLRKPNGGCPWDLKQTFETLKPLLIEEAYEVADAVDSGPTAVKEELGDLLSLIGLFSQIAREQGLFSFESVVEGISDKLVRRHPHVFGDTAVSGAAEVLKNWEAIKKQERADGGEPTKGLLDGIPRSLPALLTAQQVGERCHRVGFDWSDAAGVVEKIREEVQEFLTEAKEGAKNTENKSRMQEELGDLLFTLAQYSRHLGFNAEDALRAANTKFINRFKALEQLARERHGNTALSELGPEALEALWAEAKGLTPYSV